jgi:AcrR family transcriptional regulator
MSQSGFLDDMMPATRKRQKRVERTRDQILKAAALRFAESGFDGTRLEDVGQDVGIGRSGVLYHFTDKQLLYRAVLDEMFGGLMGVLRSSLIAGGTLADRLEDGVCAFVDYMGRYPTVARLALRESINPDPKIREEIQAQALPFLSLLEMIFEEGERSGVFRPLRSDPLHFVSAVAGATLFYVAALPNLVRELPYDLLCDEQLEAHKLDVLNITRRLLGIRGPKAM